MDKDAYIKALEKQTTDTAAQRFILALVKQNPGLSQLSRTCLGKNHQNASTTTLNKSQIQLTHTEHITSATKDQSLPGQNDNLLNGGNDG